VALNGITLWFNSADSLLAAIFVILLFLLYPNFICLEESPIWLIRQKKYDLAVKTFKKISEINDRRVPSNLFPKLLATLESNQFQQKSESEENTKLTLLGKLKLLFMNGEYCKQLFIMCTISSSLYCIYYGILTSVNDIGFSSIQLNGALVGITQAAGFIIVLKFLPKTPRKKALLLIQSILLLGGFLLVSLSFYERTEIVQMAEGIISTLFISTTLSSLFSFMHVTNAESFPTQIRGLAAGITLLVGKLVGSFAPYVSLFSKYMKVHVLAGSSYTLFISIYATLYLRETIESYKK
jgi:Major Facilitator Superfamily